MIISEHSHAPHSSKASSHVTLPSNSLKSQVLGCELSVHSPHPQKVITTAKAAFDLYIPKEPYSSHIQHNPAHNETLDCSLPPAHTACRPVSSFLWPALHPLPQPSSGVFLPCCHARTSLLPLQEASGSLHILLSSSITHDTHMGPISH